LTDPRPVGTRKGVGRSHGEAANGAERAPSVGVRPARHNLGSPDAGATVGRPPRGGPMLAEDQDTQDVEDLTDDDAEELLVEEVSIDGMCGVY
jgi:mycofactocin precursor